MLEFHNIFLFNIAYWYLKLNVHVYPCREFHGAAFGKKIGEKVETVRRKVENKKWLIFPGPPDTKMELNSLHKENTMGG